MIINPFQVGTGVINFTTEYIVWENKTNVTETANSGLDCLTGAGWLSYARSQQSTSGQIKAQFQMPSGETSGHSMLGLINSTAAGEEPIYYTALPYAIYLYTTALYAVESGNVFDLSATVTTSDIISVERAANGRIQYRKNSTLLREVVSPVLTNPIKAMMFMELESSKVTQCKITYPA